ncbi:hypothetical protein CTI12_AA085900 [Artemisia annua]|uniref:ALOG domain-containing protein n=1 Tax=Artemisia annua TaxID=35608 RepID=A0A2U1Q167_ARTAN|nr:hypothetical protein CTI12_AA085900 [Artemisia annua]
MRHSAKIYLEDHPFFPKNTQELSSQSTSTCPVSHQKYPSEGSSRSASADQSQNPTPLSRYESQKRRDWNTFGQYLKNQRPPVSLSQCNFSHVLEFLRYLDQFGKTKVHLHGCVFFGQPDPPAPCTCPLRQAWGSLDALIGRLRAAYEENGGSPENNPFGNGAIRVYLREGKKLPYRDPLHVSSLLDSICDIHLFLLSSLFIFTIFHPGGSSIFSQKHTRTFFTKHIYMSSITPKDPSEGSSRSASADQSQNPTPLSRYESQKRRDWNTFGQYLKNQRPPVSLSQCNFSHVLEFLRYLDQFGKTKVHLHGCVFFGQPDPPAPCTCPLRQAWGSLDALIGRLRAAYEENGGSPENNPFGNGAIRVYLREGKKLPYRDPLHVSSLLDSICDIHLFLLSSLFIFTIFHPGGSSIFSQKHTRTFFTKHIYMSSITPKDPSEGSSRSASADQSQNPTPLSRYESQKRRDWNTFGQYLKNQRPPVSLSQCNFSHVLEFLRYLDQFGKTKVHLHGCVFFGQPDPPAPCTCPLRQAWGSLDALIGRLRAAYEENGGSPENNPFGNGAIRVYLREVVCENFPVLHGLFCVIQNVFRGSSIFSQKHTRTFFTKHIYMSSITPKDPSEGSSRSASADQSQNPTPLSRYESQKRRDWNTFGQYLKNQRPPVSLSQCNFSHVLEFLRYLDQFGKTKVHLHGCVFFGQPDPPAPCTCPLRQAWGSLDALIGRLRAAYEENGGSPENNPFGNGAIRVYLREDLLRFCAPYG